LEVSGRYPPYPGTGTIVSKLNFLRIASAILLLLAGPATAMPSDIASLLLLQSVEERVASVGYRLQTNAGDICAVQVPLAGMQLHDASQYGRDDAENLAVAFGSGPWPKVLAVVRGGAAARAGVTANDSILAIDGQAVPAAGQGYARVYATLGLLDQALADGHAALSLERAGKPVSVDLVADRGCASRFQIKISGARQGKADGAYVEINTGLIAFAHGDGELAAAIAHELAHNILRHRAKLDAGGVTRGILQNFGKSARLTKETEIEADRLSVYLVDRAGYPLSDAISFWERFGKASFDFGDNTHPGAKTRVANIRAEVAKVEAAKARGEVPKFVPAG
jgi:hypothetical protein